MTTTAAYLPTGVEQPVWYGHPSHTHTFANQSITTTGIWTGNSTSDTFIVPGLTTAAPLDYEWNYTPFIPPVTTVRWEIPNNQPKNGDNIMKRLVEVFVVDPNKNVPDDRSLVHHVTPFMTSETDEEIKMGLGLKDVLKAHNEFRVTLVNEDRSEGRDKDVNVKPAKLSDLVVKISTVEEF